MSRLQPFPIAGGSYKDDTLPWSAQDTVNWLPVTAEKPGTTSPMLLRGVPGLQTVVGGAQSAGLPVRGGYDADGFCVVVIGQSLYRFDGSATTLLGTIPGIQRVQFAHNQVAGGVQIAIATGTGGYVYDTAAQTLAQITDDAFPGAKSFAYMDSYIIGVDPTGNFWFNSDLANATSYNALNRYEAESEPDRIQTLLVSHEDVVIFGARTTEFWYDSGANINTFQRRDGTGFEIGCVSPWAAVNLDNTVYWRGHDGSAYRLNGYTAQRISTGPIEQDWAKSDPSQCFAMTFVDRGHKIVYWTQPDGKTWGYDVATGEWHRRASHLMDRWRANCLFRHKTTWYAGDYTNGRLYALGWRVNTEGGHPLVAERATTVVQDNRNRFRFNAVEIVVDAQESRAVHPSSAGPGFVAISGDLPDGAVGDVVSYQYAIESDSPTTADISSGALPAGLGISQSGLVTGAYAAPGQSTWEARATTIDGYPATVRDSANVTDTRKMKWWLVLAGDSTGKTYISADPSSFTTSITRSPSATPAQDSWYTGGRFSAIGSASLDTTNDFPISGAITSEVVAFPSQVSNNSNHVIKVGDSLVVRGTGSYSISFDGGVTWATHAGPDANEIRGMGRLASGRWIIHTFTTNFYYSDDTSAPVNWTPIGTLPVGQSGIFVTPTGAFALGNTGGSISSTTDGAIWVTNTNFPVTYSEATVYGAVDDNGNCVISGGTLNTVAVSHDSGATWSTATLPGASTGAGDIRIKCGNGIFMACSGGMLFYSADFGDTWIQSTAPTGTPLVEWVGP